jgi:hypothetical protein
VGSADADARRPDRRGRRRPRFDSIAEDAHVASSLWRSIAEAAERGERATLIQYCDQAGDVSSEVFQVAKKLGSVEPA